MILLKGAYKFSLKVCAKLVLVSEENKQMRKMKQLLAPQKNTDLITTCNKFWRMEERENVYNVERRWTWSKGAQVTFSVVGRWTIIRIEISENSIMVILFRNIEIHMRRNSCERVEIRSSLRNRDQEMGVVGQQRSC